MNEEESNAPPLDEAADSGDDPALGPGDKQNAGPEQQKTLEECLEFYKSQDINLVPVQPRSKIPAVKSWKELQTRRITDEEINEFFFQKRCNVGLVCGAISDNLFVLDFDDPRIFKRWFPNGCTGLPLVRTGRGFHVYVKGTQPVKTMKIYDEDDREVVTLKGEGTYVLAPPSVHTNGRNYEFVNFCSIPRMDDDPQQIIADLAQKLGLHPKTSEKDISEVLDGVTEGKRGEALLQLISYLIKSGESKKAIQKKVLEWNQLNQPPLDKNYVFKKIDVLIENGPYGYCYTDDPEKHIIKLDTTGEKTKLTIEKKTTRSRRRASSTKEEEGLNPDELTLLIAEELLSENHFFTLKDTKEVYIYQDGLYTNHGDAFIEQQVGWRTRNLEGEEGKPFFRTAFIKNLLNLIKTETYVDRKDINHEKNLINLENGLMNIETGEFSAHNPKVLSTVRIPIVYNKNAQCPKIDAFLHEILDKNDVQKIYELAGYCLLRAYPIQAWFLFYGEGENGKSTLIDLLIAFLGKANVAAVPLQRLNDRFSTGDLYGKYANIVADISNQDLKYTYMLKALTGSDLIRAEEKYGKSFTFYNYAKLIFACNKLPMSGDDTRAFYRRIVLIPFSRTIPKERRDPNLIIKLTTPDELSGFLNKAIAGLHELLARGEFANMPTPDEIEERYKKASNTVFSFFKDRVIIEPSAYVFKSELYDAYQLYCNENQVPSVSQKKFSQQLHEMVRLEEQRKGSGEDRHFAWIGIRLRTISDEPDNGQVM